MVLEKHLRRAVRFDAGKFSRQTVAVGADRSFELVSLPLHAATLPPASFP